MTAPTTVCQSPGCGRPVTDAPVCEPCRRRVERSLGEVPALVAELDVTLAHLSRQPAITLHHGKVGPSPLLHMAASAAQVTLRATLRQWVRLTARQATPARPADAQRLAERPTVKLAVWLLGHSEQLRHHPAAGSAVQHITTATETAWRVIDLPANRTTFAVGPCPELTDHGPCPGEVRAYVPRDQGTLARITCTACGATWFAWQWTRAGERILRRKALLRPAATRRVLDATGGYLTRSA